MSTAHASVSKRLRSAARLWENQGMIAYLVLLLALLSRVLPHLMGVTGASVTLTGAGLLFFGSRLRPQHRWQAILAIAGFALTDWWLTVYAYSFPFHASEYVLTWLWYGAVVLASSALLGRRRNVLRVGSAALASSTSFFVLSNGAVWLGGSTYPHTGSGLLECYAAGLPFYRNDLASTLMFSAVFFALPYAASVLREAAQNAAHTSER